MCEKPGVKTRSLSISKQSTNQTNLEGWRGNARRPSLGEKQQNTNGNNKGKGANQKGERGGRDKGKTTQER